MISAGHRLLKPDRRATEVIMKILLVIKAQIIKSILHSRYIFLNCFSFSIEKNLEAKNRKTMSIIRRRFECSFHPQLIKLGTIYKSAFFI